MSNALDLEDQVLVGELLSLAVRFGRASGLIELGLLTQELIDAEKRCGVDAKDLVKRSLRLAYQAAKDAYRPFLKHVAPGVQVAPELVAPELESEDR